MIRKSKYLTIKGFNNWNSMHLFIISSYCKFIFCMGLFYSLMSYFYGAQETISA